MRARSVVSVVLCLGLVAVLGPAAEAHLAGTIRGIHYSSIKCIDEVSGVPGTALGDDPSKPAFVVCTVHATEIEILCQNSQGHTVAKSAGINVTVEAENQIDDGEITDKKKGIATVEATVSDDPFLDAEFCTSQTWIPIQVLVTAFDVTVSVKQCTDSNCLGTIITASEEKQSCVKPAGTSVEHLPLPGDAYDCDPVSKLHLK
jgi:hypothetical protein